MTDTPLHSVSVAGVAFDDEGRVLLIKRRDNGQWQAPGGVLELDETFEQGVIREVLEETGVRVEVCTLTGVYKNLKLGVVALVYRCRPLDGDAAVSTESEQVAWVDLDQALKLMAPAFAVRILDATARNGQTPTRAHDGTNLVLTTE
ncbi:NUDIX hydrolase [Actinomycetospora sp. TBRC 11914]|uniref:NUDIX hydrolase n=1 Tax=Actinomycetospora sp. TBRC 11914 TaxID=2729387 RepID=UPI00145D489D|nr:NUDIX domain-containing protein [Actinomycetospora sp. TBRC 11914]NMO91810.1 NUDIX domain-containing protein [Actinomycetospora sp. TBRC 11914]